MKVESGHTVKVHYKGTLSDGTEFDNSHERGQPIGFEVGSGLMIPGFNDAVVGMAEGQVKTVTLKPEAAYGTRDPGAFQAVPKDAFGEDFVFELGGTIQGNGPAGPFLAKIHAVEQDEVILDMNHPLAGEDLTFEIEVVSIDSDEEWNPSMKKPQLLEVARARGLSVNTRSTKAQLIQALSA